MSEFTFDCPSCGQHILASTDWVGRKMTCPSCDVTFAIPLPGHAPVVESSEKNASPKPPSRRPKVRMRVNVPPATRAAGGKARPRSRRNSG